MAKDADIMVRVGGDTVQLQASMTKAGNKIRTFEKGAIASTKKINKAMSALKFVAAGVALNYVVKQTIEFEKASAQLEATLKSMGNQTGFTRKELEKMAGAMSKASITSETELISAMSKLATFGNVAGDVFGRAMAVIDDMSIKLGNDLKSGVLQVGKALNDPVKGVSALMEVGASFTDEQKNMIKALVDTGKVAQAQTIILRELEKEFGGSAKAAREILGGSLQALQNAFGDLLKADDGMPGVTDAINELTETLQDPQVKEGFQNLISAVAKLIELAAKGAAAITDLTKSIGEGAAKAIYGPILIDDLDALNKMIRKSQSEIDRLREKQEQYTKAAGMASSQIQGDIDKESKKLSELWGLWFHFHSEQPKAQQKTADANTEATDTIVNNTNKQIEAAKELVAQNERVKELLSKPLPEMGQFQDPETGMLEGGEGFKEGQQEYLNQLAMKLEALKEFNKTESEIEAERYALELETLKQSFDNKLLLEEEYNAMREDAKKAHEDRMTKITDKSNKTQAQLVAGSLMDMLGSMATHNKKAFELNKKARLAEAVISGVKSAVSAWEAGMSTGGPWAPAVAAAYTAASLAKTGALISQIQSQSFSGGGGQGGAAGAGGSGVAAAAPQQQQPSRIVQIDFQGGDYERQIAGNIVNILSEEIKRGAVIEGVQMA